MYQKFFDTLLPLRCLEYIGRIFKNILEMRDRYARLLIKIPTPEFYVFYTGNESISAMQELKLSDAFIQKIEAPQLELIVKVINLNSKENEGFLESCPILKEYAKFVSIVKDFKLKQGKKGYDMAIRYCIKNNILKNYIISHAKEVEGMLVAEYDYNLDLQVQREECYKKGILEGMQQGMEKGLLNGLQKGLQKGKKEGRLEGKKEGKEEERMTLARRMKKANFDVSVIQEITKLSSEEIEKL